MGQVDESRPADGELLESVGFAARVGGGKTVGAEPRAGEAEIAEVLVHACRKVRGKGVARAIFEGADHAGFGAGGDIDHAADRLAAPDRAVGAAQDVELARHACKLVAEVEPAARSRWIGHAHAVDEDQQLVRARPANVHAGEAADAAIAR